MTEQLITNKGLTSHHCLKIGHDEICHYKNISIEELDDYQYLQMKHDEVYHHDIFVLNISQRMTHVALHLVKYLASLSFFPVSAPENRKAFIDSFIMVASASNLLGISLSEHLETEEENNNLSEAFIDEYIKLLSKLAKACEATDHQEDYPIRSSWDKSIRGFLSLILREASSRNIFLLREATSRLASVEKAYPLNAILRKRE